MLLLNVTLPTPEENLALDEALLESAEAGESQSEVLRFWESPSLFVVLGRSSPYSTEVNHEHCSVNKIPVLRRCSGGATVVAGPGCLMYAVLLDYEKRPELRMLDVAHQFVMSKLLNAATRVGLDVTMQGTCDLVFNGRKVSGNALRCKRRFMVYHGTLLLTLPIETIANCLRKPKRQPEYRNDRSHSEFLSHLPVDRQTIQDAIAREWSAENSEWNWPKARTQELARIKYSDIQWTKKT